MLVADLPPIFYRVLAFTFGAIWGSFFNVAIYRWPREMSVVTPPSHCPHCGVPVVAWRNVPIFAYLFMRGRAGCCGAKLTPRYVLVELVSGLLCLALAERLIIDSEPGAEFTPLAVETLLYFMFVGGLIVATFVDLEWMEIPDEVSLPLTAIGLVTVGLREVPGAESAALGAGAGFLLIQVLFVWSYERLTGRRGMGEGDSKFLMMIGAFTGWRGALFALVAGALQGVLFAAFALLAGKELTPTRPDELDEELGEQPTEELDAPEEPAGEEHDDSEDEEKYVGGLKLPFGPFLALGALEFIFFGELLIEQYIAYFID